MKTSWQLKEETNADGTDALGATPNAITTEAEGVVASGVTPTTGSTPATGTTTLVWHDPRRVCTGPRKATTAALEPDATGVEEDG